MLIRIFIFIVLLSLYSCRDFNSRKYINRENEAISDLIHEMIDYHDRITMNGIDTAKARLYLQTTMDTMICKIDPPGGYVISVDNVRLPTEEIEENKKKYENEYKKYRREFKLFAPLRDGQLKRRKIDFNFNYSNLQIEFTSKNNDELTFQKNDLGYLYVSRIIFKHSFSKGYLTFAYYCGEGCAWIYNIEIEKIDGKWKISKRLSGWIA
ncbi:hypothetical protein [Marinifilum caeruleilacunae]|uniref:Lipoprotein n=1 Tax=Marinifilum caeruleilacunae TaxID=2499076 RepID=A0ABX1WR69_9BACT|nr:hypothetical protein [Marinifilum caeruleilacunae]NOU58492.1 hypothetical protein [Marinifilum caeruleilacunae]